MNYQRITGTDDPDIPYLTAILHLPEISRFLSIDDDQYWNYVTSSENVCYYKAYEGGSLVGAVHLETDQKTLYMDIMVMPDYQRRGMGTKILGDILGGKFPISFDTVEVSIDEANTASVRLFEKMGFLRVSQEDELINYRYFAET